MRSPPESIDPTPPISGYAHSTITMALEVDRLSQKVEDLTAQNEELESTIMYHLQAMDETHSESTALHTILKLIKSYPHSKVSDLTSKVIEALLAAGCADLAKLVDRRELKAEAPRRNSDQLDILVNLILNGHKP